MSKLCWSVLGNSQKLDGGSMFGNAPKAMWSHWATVDDANRIDLACRCLLVKDGDRTILFEAGIGAFFSKEMRDRYGVQEGEHMLLRNLAAIGVQPEDIDVVMLSHLHFDHAGGVLAAHRDGEAAELVFPNARYVVGEDAWQRAITPHSRDRKSFIPELQPLLEATGRLERVVGEHSETLGADYRLHKSSGHTPGMLLTEVRDAEPRGAKMRANRGPIVFCADLIPGVPWVRRAITMGYDRFPELLIDEKAALLDDLVARSGRLFFTHDPDIAMCQLRRNDKGHVVVGETSKALQGEPV
ncbi:MAG: glyoxylase-like metal-dependent hydrolase (beta-lactamase superfamily II) [Planctomycetota bacterium]|jgi:glyoxylase-like metal-dependent hydrolase (beta-lactamase superfamily II)